MTKLSALVDSLQKQLATSGKKTPNASPDSTRRLVTIDNLVRYELFTISLLTISGQTDFSGEICVIRKILYKPLSNSDMTISQKFLVG